MEGGGDGREHEMKYHPYRAGMGGGLVVEGEECLPRNRKGGEGLSFSNTLSAPTMYA